jgi:hypothetical protein
MTNSNYRTPSIEEFVEGFEYEFLTYHMDIEDDVDINHLAQSGWVKQKFVVNKHFPSVQIHDIVDYIMKGRIRCQNIPRIH